ncbi:hypothetical protein BJ165DRAFT_1409956 [Panaeolus papilionaceus]|nr:hypothetical protein BJ165DRAFT_1409956 [Panaeolus papilionaceus]
MPVAEKTVGSAMSSDENYPMRSVNPVFPGFSWISERKSNYIAENVEKPDSEHLYFTAVVSKRVAADNERHLLNLTAGLMIVMNPSHVLYEIIFVNRSPVWKQAAFVVLALNNTAFLTIVIGLVAHLALRDNYQRPGSPKITSLLDHLSGPVTCFDRTFDSAMASLGNWATKSPIGGNLFSLLWLFMLTSKSAVRVLEDKTREIDTLS